MKVIVLACPNSAPYRRSERAMRSWGADPAQDDELTLDLEGEAVAPVDPCLPDLPLLIDAPRFQRGVTGS